MNSNYNGNLFVTIKYPETATATASVTIPGTSQPVITSSPAPIKISLTQSNWPEEDTEQVTFDITLNKQQNSDISLQDFSAAGANETYFSAQLDNKQLDCSVAGNPIQENIVNFKDGMDIKCTTTIGNTNPQNYPLVITMMYGVSITQQYPFSIQTQTPGGNSNPNGGGAGDGGSSGAG